MSRIHKIATVGLVGIMLGTTMSMYTASFAGARAYRNCDNQVVNMEKAAARDLAKGKLSQADYDKVMLEIAYHRTLWGC